MDRHDVEMTRRAGFVSPLDESRIHTGGTAENHQRIDINSFNTSYVSLSNLAYARIGVPPELPEVRLVPDFPGGDIVFVTPDDFCNITAPRIQILVGGVGPRHIIIQYRRQLNTRFACLPNGFVQMLETPYAPLVTAVRHRGPSAFRRVP